MSSVPLTPRPEVAGFAGPPLRRRGVAGLAHSLARGIRLSLSVPVRKRVLGLGLVGVTLTLWVAGAAWLCLAQVTSTNQQLAEVNRAQRYHQDADMMHDALRTDVARAMHVGAVVGDESAAGSLRADTDAHARQFRRDIAASLGLQLPVPVSQALADLRPEQRAYVTDAAAMVDALLRGETVDDGRAERQVERGFRVLARQQANVTELLARTAVRTERAAAVQKDQAVRRLAIASVAALAAWFGLLLWQQRSMGRLHGALLREAEHRSASDVLQRSLLPQHLPRLAGLQVAARTLPGGSGNRIGGDWYDVIPLPTGHVGLVIGDVLGHDLTAASAMGQLRNALRAYALDDPSPASVLSRLNRAVDLLDVVELATCLYAVLDPGTLRVTWASAGHLPPLVSPQEGPGHIVAADPGPPLGAVPAAHYVDHTLGLRRGESLALYTDGLVERRGTSIDVGLAHLVAAAGPYCSAEDMCHRLMAGMLGTEQPHHDDVTLLVVRALAASRHNDHVA
jgi:serine phosphatase RsbU (regulator of sigma subunit)